MPLVIHFLNVGHGDCTIIEFPGRLTMVDINNSKSLPEEDQIALLLNAGFSESDIRVAKMLGTLEAKSDPFKKLLVDPVEFYKSHYGAAPIFRYIQTHPDMDHMSGLFRLSKQESIPIINFWDIDNEKVMSEQDFENSPYFYGDWLMYQILRLGRDGNGNDVKVIRLKRGASAQYYADDGISILAPTPELETKAKENGEYNLASYVLRIQYGDCRIILGGDAEEETWKDIYENYSDDFLKADLLKASHHGRRSGYYQPAVKAINPKHTIVSVGKKPATDASHLYAQYSQVFSTRYRGTITAKCWAEGDVWLYDSSGNRIDSSTASASLSSLLGFR